MLSSVEIIKRIASLQTEERALYDEFMAATQDRRSGLRSLHRAVAASIQEAFADYRIAVHLRGLEGLYSHR
jgi:hypothetical protein